SRTGDPYRNPAISTYTSAAATASAHACAGFSCCAGKYAMSVTASPALITASCAAATNERPAGYRRSSAVWDKNTRRGGGSLGITHSIPALTQRENTQFAGGRACTASPRALRQT